MRILTALLLFYISPTLLAVPIQGSKILITGASKYANQIGKNIYLKGGNVFDAAVAVGLSMAVTNQRHASLGGGGFALIRNKNKVYALDFREMAPAVADKNYFKDTPDYASTTGGKAIGVPGYLAGLYAIHKKFGKLKWGQLFKAPIRLATRGFRVEGEWANVTDKEKKRFNKAGKKYFFKKNKSYLPGQVIKQPQLAKALKLIKKNKLAGFYRGPVAKDIVSSIKKSKGQMTLDDLKNYKVKWRDPVSTNFNGYKVHFMPLPSSGGIVAKTALSLIEKLELNKNKNLSANEFHIMGEILSRSFRSRFLLGDSDFAKVPQEKLLSDKFIFDLAKTISLKKTKKLDALTEQAPKESTETTHFNVMDTLGNAISLTVTLNANYGSGVVTSKYGIALNNEMDDFNTRPGKPNMYGLVQGLANTVESKKRPLSSMTPTIVEKNNSLYMILGAPGGPRIISGVIYTLYRTLVKNQNIELAIQAPRVHHQFLPHKLYYDKDRVSPDTLTLLKSKGHLLEPSWMGRVNAIMINASGLLEAAIDSRSEGNITGI